MTIRKPAATERVNLLAASALVFLIPLAAYGRTVFWRYGFRDDYPLLWESQHQPGKVLAVCGSQGRVIYGWLLESAISAAGSIDALQWIRLGGVLGLAILSVAVLVLAVRAGWHLGFATALAALVSLSPPAQVLASWTICSPQALALLAGVAAFWLIEWHLFQERRNARRVGSWIAAVGAMTAGALIYQPNSLLYAVLIGAALVQRRNESLKTSLRWLVEHLTVVLVGLTASFALMKVTFALKWFSPSARVTVTRRFPSRFRAMALSLRRPHILMSPRAAAGVTTLPASVAAPGSAPTHPGRCRTRSCRRASGISPTRSSRASASSGP